MVNLPNLSEAPAHLARLGGYGLAAGVPGTGSEFLNFFVRWMTNKVAMGQKINQSLIMSLIQKGIIKFVVGVGWYYGGMLVLPAGGRMQHAAEIGAYSTVGTILTDIADTAMAAVEGSAAGQRPLSNLASQTLTYSHFFKDEDDTMQ